MGLVLAMERRRWAPEDDRWYQPVIPTTAAGEKVNAETAMGATAVFAAVSLLSATIGSVPLKLMRRVDRTTEPARDDPLYDVMHRRPNRWQTAFEWREMQQGHVLTRGNAFSQIVRSRAGTIMELVPLNPARMKLQLTEGGDLVYVYRDSSGESEAFSPREILHTRGFGSNGFTGYSPVSLFREGIGLSLAMEKQGSAWMGNQARPSGILTTPETLSDPQKENLKASWESAYSGVNQGRVAVMEYGLEWQAIGFNAEDAQFIEGRVFQVSEVARMFNVPPNKLHELSRAHFNNVEQANLSWVIDSVRPWAERLEQRYDISLLSEGQRSGGLFFKFQLEGLLRGDQTARAAFYNSLFQLGSLSPNDIREKEDMNPVDGGDEYFVQLNMVPLSQATEVMLEPTGGEQQALPPGDDEEDEDRALPQPEYRTAQSLRLRRRYMGRFQGLIANTVGPTIRVESEAIRRAAKAELGERGLLGFQQRVESFYANFPSEIEKRWLPVFLAYAGLVVSAAVDEVGADVLEDAEVQRFVNDYVRMAAKRHVGKSLAQLRKIIARTEADELAEAINDRLGEWQEKRATKIGLSETVRSGAAFAKLAYVTAGVTGLVWRAMGDSCPYCNRLDGQVVSVTGNFANAGSEIEGNEGDSPLRVRRNIGHPAAHSGCDCMIAAAIL